MGWLANSPQYQPGYVDQYGACVPTLIGPRYLTYEMMEDAGIPTNRPDSSPKPVALDTRQEPSPRNRKERRTDRAKARKGRA